MNQLEDEIVEIFQKIKKERPLIHCLTNHITINDCANMVLASGARPIMAEHPMETQEITAMANGLVLNLGNITDDRMKSMVLSSHIAKGLGLPIVLDPVGVTCSKLRKHFAEQLLKNNIPTIIRGNMSEIKSLCHVLSQNSGIDAGVKDEINEETAPICGALVKELACKQSAVVVATGKIDLVGTGQKLYAIENGTKLLGEVTGTGCMCAALTASYGAVGSPLAAAIVATGLMGIAGEMAQQYITKTGDGIGMFKVKLFDYVGQMEATLFLDKIKLKELE